MGIAAGRLRHRVTFQDPIEAQDTSTGAVEVIDWEDTFPDVPAEIEWSSGRESIVSAQPQSVISGTIRVRWRPGMHAKQRIVWTTSAGTRLFNIAGVLPDDVSGRSFLEIPVVELAN